MWWDFFYHIGKTFDTCLITVRKAYVHTAVDRYNKVVVVCTFYYSKTSRVIYIGALEYRVKLNSWNTSFGKVTYYSLVVIIIRMNCTK